MKLEEKWLELEILCTTTCVWKPDTPNFFYKQQGLSNESLDCENIKQRESRFEMKMAMFSKHKEKNNF